MPDALRRWGRRLTLAAAASGSVLVVSWNLAIVRLEWDHSSAVQPDDADAFLASLADETNVIRARYHLQGLKRDGDIPGIAVAVVRRGDVVWSEAMGLADVESRRPVTRRTRFRIQSLSKNMTASAMMRVYERGDINLDAPIQTYVSFPDKGSPITLRQIASHRSGIRGYRDDREALTAGHCNTALDSVATFQNDPLVFAPDTDSVYSNYGYMLLGAALEGATGHAFPEVMRREVLEPLEMRDTVELHAEAPSGDVSAVYDFVTPYSRDGARVPSPALDFTCKWPSGGYLSTAEDMARFAAAHDGRADSFLRPESIRMQFQPRTPPGSSIGVALGWLVARDWRFRRVVFNFGAGSGGRAFLALYPDQNVAVAVVANLGHARMDMRRLVGIAVPFLDAKRQPAPELMGLVVLAGWIWYVRKRRATHPPSSRR